MGYKGEKKLLQTRLGGGQSGTNHKQKAKALNKEKEDSGKDTALLVFQSATESVADVRWSSFNSCKFGTTSEGGRLEIWDLSASAARPVAVFLENRKLSCMLFSEESPIIVSAGNNGAVSVFRLRIGTILHYRSLLNHLQGGSVDLRLGELTWLEPRQS
eukprot:Gb_37488 [translate_table: standard]